MSIFVKIVLCISLLMGALAPQIFIKHKKIGMPDNQIEELVEELIQRQTGITFDITSANGTDKDFDTLVLIEELLDLYDEKNIPQD